ESGALYTCGECESGKLGLPDSLTNITSPLKVTLGVPVKSAFCGGNHTLALTGDGEVFAFGNNFNGQLGLGPEITQSILPTRIVSLEDHVIIDAACGESHTAFITDRGSLYTCGEGRHGKLCSEQDDKNQNIPVKVTKFKGLTVQKVACGGCHTMVVASERQEDGLDLIGHSLDCKSEEISVLPFTNRNSLPPLQRVPIQSPNNNTEMIGSFQENQDNHLEELQDQAIDGMVAEKDIEVKSTLSGSKESSDKDDDIDADIDDEEISPKSVEPKKDKKEAISNAMDVSEDSDLEEEIKDIDENYRSPFVSDPDQEDNTDVKMECEVKKESRVSRFFNAFRRKKPSSAQSVRLEGCGEQLSIKDKCQRAASEGGVRGSAQVIQQNRGDIETSNNRNLGNERRSKTCTIL
ncbi:hypothetical protein B7P43_G15530, partial [Cryptotermes secundus]